MARPAVRALALAGAACALAAAGLTAAPGSPARPSCAEAAGTHHVALMVEHGSGATVARCVAFDSDSITGEQVLQLSGVEYATATYGSLGKAVCQVDYEPATYPPGCWTSTSPYWAMFVSRGGGPWAVSSRGVTSQTFADGDALGFHYQSQAGGAQPPPSAAGVCAVPAPAATPAPVPEPAGATTPAGGPSSTAPAPAAAPSAEPAPTDAVSSPTPISSPGPSEGPAAANPASAARGTRKGGSPGGLSAGWVLAAAGAGALAGFGALQLLGPALAARARA